MTLKEALETDHNIFVDYICQHLSVKDGERLEDLIVTLKQHAQPGLSNLVLRYRNAKQVRKDLREKDLSDAKYWQDWKEICEIIIIRERAILDHVLDKTI